MNVNILLRELTPFEQLVCEHLCDGLTNSAIARETAHTEKVIENTVSRVAQSFAIKSNGEVNLRAARKEGSWVNRATLGLLGRESKTVQAKDHVATEVEQPSLTNRLSFGLLDKPEVEEVDSAPSTAPVISNTEQPSWMNRLSFGLLDKSETPNTSEVKATN